MAQLLAAIPAMFSGAASTAGAVAGTASAVGSGFSLTSLLQGTLTVLGVVSELSAGQADAEAAELAAQDAKSEKQLETLQGIERRSSIKRAMNDALGAQDVAYAASGVDLSFGTAKQARQEAYREADYANTSDINTSQVRASRLDERFANYKKAASRARFSGFVNAATKGIQGFAAIKERGQ